MSFGTTTPTAAGWYWLINQNYPSPTVVQCMLIDNMSIGIFERQNVYDGRVYSSRPSGGVPLQPLGGQELRVW